MTLLFFATKKSARIAHLERAITTLPDGIEVKTLRRFEDLSSRLLEPKKDLAVAVLAASCMSELTDLLLFREVLSDIRLILVLPNRDKETISKALSLTPRFVAYHDSDPEELRAVLCKMISSLQLRETKFRESVTPGLETP
jgi:DNA-binding NarL/FixJ family response regulator